MASLLKSTSEEPRAPREAHLPAVAGGVGQGGQGGGAALDGAAQGGAGGALGLGALVVAPQPRLHVVLVLLQREVRAHCTQPPCRDKQTTASLCMDECSSIRQCKHYLPIGPSCWAYLPIWLETSIAESCNTNELWNTSVLVLGDVRLTALPWTFVNGRPRPGYLPPAKPGSRAPALEQHGRDLACVVLLMSGRLCRIGLGDSRNAGSDIVMDWVGSSPRANQKTRLRREERLRNL